MPGPRYTFQVLQRKIQSVQDKISDLAGWLEEGSDSLVFHSLAELQEAKREVERTEIANPPLRLSQAVEKFDDGEFRRGQGSGDEGGGGGGGDGPPNEPGNGGHAGQDTPGGPAGGAGHDNKQIDKHTSTDTQTRHPTSTQGEPEDESSVVDPNYSMQNPHIRNILEEREFIALKKEIDSVKDAITSLETAAAVFQTPFGKDDAREKLVKCGMDATVERLKTVVMSSGSGVERFKVQLEDVSGAIIELSGLEHEVVQFNSTEKAMARQAMENKLTESYVAEFKDLVKRLNEALADDGGNGGEGSGHDGGDGGNGGSEPGNDHASGSSLPDEMNPDGPDDPKTTDNKPSGFSNTKHSPARQDVRKYSHTPPSQSIGASYADLDVKLTGVPPYLANAISSKILDDLAKASDAFGPQQTSIPHAGHQNANTATHSQGNDAASTQLVKLEEDQKEQGIHLRGGMGFDETNDSDQDQDTNRSGSNNTTRPRTRRAIHTNSGIAQCSCEEESSGNLDPQVDNFQPSLGSSKAHDVNQSSATSVEGPDTQSSHGTTRSTKEIIRELREVHRVSKSQQEMLKECIYKLEEQLGKSDEQPDVASDPDRVYWSGEEDQYTPNTAPWRQTPPVIGTLRGGRAAAKESQSMSNVHTTASLFATNSQLGVSNGVSQSDSNKKLNASPGGVSQLAHRGPSQQPQDTQTGDAQPSALDPADVAVSQSARVDAGARSSAGNGPTGVVGGPKSREITGFENEDLYSAD